MIRAHVRGMVRHSTLYVLAAAVAAGLGFWAAQSRFGPPAASGLPSAPAIAMRAVTLFPGTRAIAPFRLDGADGKPLTSESLRGHWTLVFLGFTHCPDVCPTTLQTLGMAEKSWAALPASTRPRVLFVSVDPERDTPAKAGEYARFFGKDILAATADATTLDAFAHGLGMVYMKVKTPDGGYTIDHSAAVSLLDPQGRMAGLIRPPFDAEAIGEDLLKLARSAPTGSP